MCIKTFKNLCHCAITHMEIWIGDFILRSLILKTKMMSVLIWSPKKAPEKTLPFCLANSSRAFLGTLLLQCWGGRHANVSPRKKTLPQTLHFQRQAQLLKVTTTKAKGQERPVWAWTWDKRHASIYLLLLGLMLCSCWFWLLTKRKDSANFIGQHFVLITEPWETPWRHNTGNYWKMCHLPV